MTKRGDVVLMIAPRELGKPRPAIVIQTDALTRRRQFLFVR